MIVVCVVLTADCQRDKRVLLRGSGCGGSASAVDLAGRLWGLEKRVPEVQQQQQQLNSG